MTNHYDLIGDIHGYHQSLAALLERLGYVREAGVYRHHENSRKVIFLGDFIDRGPGQREVLAMVRPMIDQGQALAVMGNHEFNAIAYATPHPEREGYLRAHEEKNIRMHGAFLDAYPVAGPDYQEVIDWFKRLPLWLDLGALRVVHACWDTQCIENLGSAALTDELLVMASQKGTWQYTAVETLLKGKEIPLKAGHSFKDKDGNPRHRIRVRWWDRSAKTYKKAFLGPESALTDIPEDEIAGDHLIDYVHTAPPVFLGHYWMESAPCVLATNIACLDYSVARAGGKLVAYRWDGEQTLSDTKFVYVDRIET